MVSLDYICKLNLTFVLLTVTMSYKLMVKKKSEPPCSEFQMNRDHQQSIMNHSLCACEVWASESATPLASFIPLLKADSIRPASLLPTHLF